MQNQFQYLLIINTYFPCDPRSAELLGDLESILSNLQFTNILIAGDLNCHCPRNSNFTTFVKHWLEKYNLQIFWSLDDGRIEPVDYTFINTSNESVSCSNIYHLLLSICVNMHNRRMVVTKWRLHSTGEQDCTHRRTGLHWQSARRLSPPTLPLHQSTTFHISPLMLRN